MFCLVAFDPIELLTCLAPQNDPQNLSFVKYMYAVVKKRSEIVVKWPNLKVVFFELTRTIHVLRLS